MRELMQVGYNIRPYPHGAVARLGIPGTQFVDGPRGCVAGKGTAFPVSMARGATWDVALEEQVVQVYGRRTEGEHKKEQYLVGFQPVKVPAGSSVRLEVPVSLQPLAAWNPVKKIREPPASTTVELLVGAHAKDPAACRIPVPV